MREFRLSKAQKAKLNNTKERKAKQIIEEIAQRRQLHIKWCKEKAIKTIKAGDPQRALISFQHNMKTKLETSVHLALFLIPQLSREGKLNTTQQIQEFIEGFN